MNEPLSITRDEFMKVVSTPVPESMSETKDAFVLQCCLGCRGEDFKQMSLMNIRISEEGIPYIYYVHKAVRKCARNEFKYDIEVPMVKIAFDIFSVALSVVLSLLLFGGRVVGLREGTVLASVCTGLAVKFFTKRLKGPLDQLLSDCVRPSWIHRMARW